MLDRLPKTDIYQFVSSRKRAITGREAAEQRKRDKSKARRRADIEAQQAYNEEQYIRVEIVLGT